jgi:hypothetical protein
MFNLDMMHTWGAFGKAVVGCGNSPSRLVFGGPMLHPTRKSPVAVRVALFAAIFGLAAATAPGAAPASAQVVGQSPAALQNVAAVDAQVAVVWADGITKDGGPTETGYQEAFAAEFRQGLQRGGIGISEEAPNYLYCTIALLYEDNGMVSAAQAIELHEPTGEDAQWAITWTHMQVFTVGLQHFSGQDDAQWCHETFAEEWRQRNAGD